MARTHGRTPRGERLRCPVPQGHRKITTFVADLRNHGMVAPMVLDGPITGKAFQAYVEQALVPELRLGDIVILDNLLSSHKGCKVRHAIQKGRRQPALPPPPVPTSTRSSPPSPNPEPCCAKRTSEPSKNSTTGDLPRPGGPE